MSLAAAPVLTGPTGSLLDLIGKTPMVEVTRIDTGPCRLFLKLESQNPGGSIKDRIALSMIEAAEREGFLKPGGTIVEATAGNTGVGLARVEVGEHRIGGLPAEAGHARELVQAGPAHPGHAAEVLQQGGAPRAAHARDLVELAPQGPLVPPRSVVLDGVLVRLVPDA